MKVTIERKTLNTLKAYVKHCDIELGGLGLVVPNPKTDTYHVSEVFLLNQEAGAAHTDLDAQDVSKLMFETKDKAGHLSFWWHSHVNMGAFWSGTDTNTIKEMATEGMCVALVLNKKGEYKCAVGEKTLSGMIYIKEEVPLEVIDEVIDEEALKLEVKEKVKQRRVASSYYGDETWRSRSPWSNPNWDKEEDDKWKEGQGTQISLLGSGREPVRSGQDSSRSVNTTLSGETPTWFEKQCPEWDKLPKSVKLQYGDDIVEYYWQRHHA